MKKAFLLLFITVLTTSLSALDRPNTLEVKKVIDYYKHGKDSGVILVESMLCRAIHRDGPNKHNAKDVVSHTSFKKGEKIYLWMNFLVPEHTKANIHFEYRRKGKARQISELLISTATRYRSWKIVPTNKTGTWEVLISQELANKDIELTKITYTVD
jgi:hypothetical protein